MENEYTILPVEIMAQRFRSAMPRLPIIAGNTVLNFALDNFRRQGFMGNTFQPWKPRKNPTKWGTVPVRNGRAILILTGRGRRSLRILRANMDEVVTGSTEAYMKAHNDGVRSGQIQHVGEFQRKVTKLGVVSTVSRKKTTGIRFGRMETGTSTVRAHTRRINQNIPARPFLADSPYLRAMLNREVGAFIMKAIKP